MSDETVARWKTHPDYLSVPLIDRLLDQPGLSKGDRQWLRRKKRQLMAPTTRQALYGMRRGRLSAPEQDRVDFMDTLEDAMDRIVKSECRDP